MDNKKIKSIGKVLRGIEKQKIESTNVFKNVKNKIENDTGLIDEERLKKWRDWSKLSNQIIFQK